MTLKKWMNGKFIRRVISLQAAYGTKINKFVRLLYINEFDTLKNDEARKDDAIFKINPKDIQVTLPSPATLNYTNLNELIGNSDSIINKIVDTLVSDQENAFDENISSDEVRFQFMKSVTKEMIPMIDWGKFETLLDETVKKIVKMTPNIEEDAGGDLGDEGLGDEDMGDEGLGDEDMGDEGLDSEKEQSSGDTDTDESPETDKGTNVDESPDSKEKK